MPSNRTTSDRVIYIGVALFIAGLAILSFARPTLNYGIETDFVGGFVPEATRFLDGQPLRLAYHPPFYSISIAVFYLLSNDWVMSGMLLSLLSSALFLIAAYHFAKAVFGTREAIGAVLALACSWGFVSYSLQANSDIVFFALFYVSLYFIAAADKSENQFFWAAGGLFACLAFLTRSNGLPLLGFFLFTLAVKPRKLTRTRVILAFTTGFLIPLMVWVLYANVSASPVYVQSNHENLALSYFTRGGDRETGDALSTVNRKFSNIWQVLAHDPGHILFQYGLDLQKTLKRLFTAGIIIAFPFNLLAFPGLIFLLFKFHGRFQTVFYLNLAALILFVNLHAWSHRFYLFMIPVLGAGIINFIDHIRSFFRLEPGPRLWRTILVAFALFFLAKAGHDYTRLTKRAATDSLAASKVLRAGEDRESLLVIARKPHLGFFTGSQRSGFPNVQTITALEASVRKSIRACPDVTGVYLFYGRPESLYRPQFSMLLKPDAGAPWLKRVGHGNERGGWVLFQVIGEKI